MVNGELYFSAGPRDLCFERGDPRVKFFYGQSIQILRGQRRCGIGGFAGQDVFDIHKRQR
jgi:hypothetical protein